MKLLVLAPQWPDPPRQGAAIRNFHELHHLAQRHDVTLLTFTPEGGVIDRSRLGPILYSEILPAPNRSRGDRLRTMLSPGKPDMAWRLRSQQMWDRVGQLVRQEAFDAIQVEGIEMAPYGLHALQSGCRALTYDAHNAEYVLQRRAFTTDLGSLRTWPAALYSLVQWWRLRRFERQVCLLSNHILAVSEVDRKALANLAPAASNRITVLPNGVDTDYWSLSAQYPDSTLPANESTLVFDGTMDFRPNEDAMLWFASEIWPLIRPERPDVQFYIVGRSPGPRVQALSTAQGITVTGAVEDPRSWVAGATVYVVPMRMGGGVRLKVLQAMSMERALVSTPVGAEGVAAGNGEDLLIAGSPHAFAEATLGLLSDPERRTALGRAARATVKATYDWSVLLPTLDRVYP